MADGNVPENVVQLTKERGFWRRKMMTDSGRQEDCQIGKEKRRLPIRVRPSMKIDFFFDQLNNGIWFLLREFNHPMMVVGDWVRL